MDEAVDGLTMRVASLSERWLRQVVSRQPTPESRAYERDEKNRVKHMTGAKRDFRALLVMLQPLVDAAIAKFPDKDKLSMDRRGREFNKLAKVAPAMTSYLDTWIGTEAQHDKAYSWRNAIITQARDVLLYGKTQRDALAEVEKQAFKGFEAIVMAEAQAPYREVVPTALREYLPPKIVVEVDAEGHIQKLTDRFENEHVTLGKKVEHMHDLLKRYNAIAKKVKKDLKSSDEIIKLSALVTSILMETGIRPGKEGNGKVQMVNGEEVFIETFGAVTLGPAHVRFVRTNFVQLQFIGKMTSVNMAEIADANIIKMLQAYVDQALKKGSKFIFVTKKGVQFTYTDLQRYFRDNFAGLIPTDFRKLKATETVLAALRAEQAALYDRIRGFAKTAKGDLKDKIVAAIVEAFERAITKSQKALSHEKSTTTVKQYINPEIILRFLSTGRVEDSLEAAILSGKSKLAFDPQVFVDAAAGKTASATWTTAGGRTVQASLGDLLLELRTELSNAGVSKMATATTRLADRWAAGDEPRVAGIIQAPPLMVKAVSDWVVSTVAATVLKEEITSQKAFQATLAPRKTSEVAKKMAEVERAMQAGAKVRELFGLVADERTGLFRASWDSGSYAGEAFGIWRPSFKPFAAQYKQGNKWLLEVLTKLKVWVNGRDEWTIDNLKRKSARITELRSYIIAGGKKPIVKVQRKAFPIMKYMEGWRYKDILTDPGKIARSRKMQAEKRIADVEQQWAATQRQWAKDGKPDDAGAEEGMIGFLRRTYQKNLDELEGQTAGLAFDDVQVNVFIHQDSRALASWNPMHRVVTVYFPRATTAWGMSGLVGSVEHELQHMTQTLLQQTFGVTKAGLPKLDTLTPDFRQWMSQTEKWMKEHPTLAPERDKAMQQLDQEGVIEHDMGYGRKYRTPPQKIDFHALDDREFFTRLQDEIRTLTPMLSKLKGKARDNAIDLFTYVIPIPNSNDRDWHEKVKALGGYDELSSVLNGPSGFLKALKNVPSARGKYVRAIKEIRKALGYGGSNKAASAVDRLAARWMKRAKGTAADIKNNFTPFVSAYSDLEMAIGNASRNGQGGSDYGTRLDANQPWIRLMRTGLPIADGILATRSIPPREAKGLEMAYRLFANSRRMPKDVFKWWGLNQKRLMFIIQAAQKWPEKVEGGDELFKVGPFKVTNTIGVSGPELDTFKKALNAASKMVRKEPVPGFKRVLYGDVFYVGNIANAHAAAWYNINDDSLYIRPTNKRWGMEGAESLVHELGHRYWRKFATKEQQTAWVKHHREVDGKKVEIPMPDVGDPLPLRVRGAPRGWRPVVDHKDKTNYFYKRPDGSEGSVLAFSIWKVVKQNEGPALKFPTPYSAKNYEEHFCEALKLMAAGKLAPEHAEAFKAIWG